MWRTCVHRLVLGLVCLLACAGSASMAARAVLDLDLERQPVALADWGDWRIDESGQATLAGMLALPLKAWQPTLTAGAYPVKPGQALWIRFAVPAAPDRERWYLQVPDTQLDRVTLHTRMGNGWSAQSAGDLIAVAQWPLPQVYPVLPLAVSAAEPGNFMLRIEAAGGFSAPILFLSESQLSAGQQRLALLHGVYFGLLAMVALFALASALVFRDWAYAWFAAYSLVIVVAVASAVGMAGLHLWPESPRWNDAAEQVLSMLSFLPLLAFVAGTVSLRARSTAAYAVFCLLAAGAGIAAAAGVFLPAHQRLVLALVMVLALSAAATAATLWAWWHGDRFARWLLMAFSPMLVALPFPLGRWLQWIEQGFLTGHAMQMALGITLPTVFLLLVLRSQERRDYRRRITNLDHVDPLTGLVNDEVFQHRLRGMIGRSRRFHCESAVVLVDFTNLHGLREEFGRKAVLEVLLRLAGRLTSLVREMDTVARIGEARYGVLIEGPVPAERASQLGSKLLARLIMPFARMPMGLAVRPKVAVALVPSQGETVEAVLARLDAMLKEAPPDNRKSVYVLDSQPSSQPELP
ncbi:MAG: GGDEF domain-containing protein [Burkholderiales bacterium]|nr:GGDEF domain-containing protein [Burkholderiales bacterium]